MEDTVSELPRTARIAAAGLRLGSGRTPAVGTTPHLLRVGVLT
jgi:hypothetical protein